MKKLLVSLLIGLSFGSAMVVAQPFNSEITTVDYITVNGDSTVIARFNGGVPQCINNTAVIGRVAKPEWRRAMFSALLAAKHAGAPVSVTYQVDEKSGGPNRCQVVLVVAR